MIIKREEQYRDAVIQMNRRQRDNEPDWEQRRYEIARDIFTTEMGHYRATGEGSADAKWPARYAVEMADCLIQELQKPRNNG